MTPDRWNRAKDLFDRSFELDPDQRSRFLARACAGDLALREEVEAILAGAIHAPEMLERPAVQSFADLLATGDGAALRGRRVGPWELQDVIASGGMGTVYRARRADDQFHKQVAIKLIRAGMVDAESLRRFRNERQTLAELDHPNIARLLDGGVTDEGLPFLVMEYVEGVPMDRFCDERRLSTSARLRLFLSVCAAVQYAHQRLIVHRDLKPSNILVTPDGVPKLLDFGIAKALHPQRDRSGEPSVSEQRVLTPEYASPEQVRDEPITTASDVYSLGVNLYVLLTGHRPYRLTSRSYYEIEKAICEQEPQAPSTAVVTSVEIPATDGASRRTITPQTVSATREGEPGRLRRRLAGDVDAIVLTAMRKEPQRRYATVEKLADDIERYLAGLPVHARQGSLRYRTGKFVRRNLFGVLATTAVAASLLAAVAGTTWQARVAARQRDLALGAQRTAEREAENARVEAHKSERVTTFLQKMIAAVDPALSGRDVRVLDLLEEAAARVHAEFGDDPEVESAIHATLGPTYTALGQYDRGEHHVRAALQLQLDIHDGPHQDVARSLNRLANTLYAKGDYGRAFKASQDALDMHRALHGDVHADVADELNNLGAISRAAGDLDLAETYLRSALAMWRRLFGNSDAKVAITLNNLGNLMRVRGDLAAAEALTREAYEIRRETLGESHIDTIQSMDNLGVIVASQGRHAEALPLMRRACDAMRDALGPRHPELATSLNNLGAVCNLTDDLPTAETALREAYLIRRAALRADDPRTAYTARLLGQVLTRMERFDEAEPLLRESYESLCRKESPQHPQAQAALGALIDLYEKSRQPQKVEPLRRLQTPAASQPSRG